MEDGFVPRPLGLVIDATLNIVPKTLPHYEEFKKSLESIKESVDYAAPEAITLWWENYVDALEMFVSPETYKAAQNVWFETLVDMVNGKANFRDFL